MSGEKTFFDDGNVSVTNARAVLGTTTYAMGNITTVSVGRIVASRGGPIVITLLGALVFLVGVFGTYWGWAIFGAVLIAAGVFWLKKIKDSFYVQIGTAGGEKRGISSKNKSYIEQIVAAMNDAIIHRG